MYKLLGRMNSFISTRRNWSEGQADGHLNLETNSFLLNQFFLYLRSMKGILLRFTALFLAFVFLSHVIGIRISEHNCYDCKTSHIEVGGHLHTLHIIISLNQDHHCCDPFHEQHEDHSKSCSHKFLGYSVPFKNIEPSKLQYFSPCIASLHEMVLFHNTLEKCYEKPLVNELITIEDIQLKTCQYLT
jgi:hypothetical protein